MKGEKSIMAKQSFCRKHTVGRLKFLPLGLLFMFFGIGCLYVGLHPDEGDPGYLRWVALGAGVFVVLIGLLECFLSLRDSLFPSHSTLAKSIRSQLPDPENAPPVKELFEMVDNDVAEAKWFGKVAVGKEWVFGDEGVLISRIRGVFYNIDTHYYNRKRSVTYKLKLVDDRRQLHVYVLGSEQTMMDAYNYIRLLVPESWTNNMDALLALPEEEFGAFNRDFCIKRDKRIQQEAEQAADRAEFPQDIVLYQLDGVSTSRVSAKLVTEQLDTMEQNEQFRLQLLWDFSLPHCGTMKTMTCFKLPAEGYWIVTVYEKPDGSNAAWGKAMNRDGALDCLTHLLRHEAQDPVQAGWNAVEVRAAPAQSRQEAFKKLTVEQANGLRDEYERFTRADVEAAADGLADETYRAVQLFLGSWCIMIHLEGDTALVHATKPCPDKLRFYSTRARVSQATAWLLQLMDGRLDPDFSKWKDETDEMERTILQQNKEGQT